MPGTFLYCESCIKPKQAGLVKTYFNTLEVHIANVTGQIFKASAPVFPSGLER